MKRKCPFSQKHLLSYFLKESSEEKTSEIETHLRTCSECQQDLAILKAIRVASLNIKREIEKEVEEINWEVMARMVNQRIDQLDRKPAEVSTWRLFHRWAVAAGVMVGLLIGLLSYHYLLRPLLKPKEEIIKAHSFYQVPDDFLERVDEEMARKEVLNYLEKCRLVFLSMKQATEVDLDEAIILPKERIQDLIRQKRYFSPQLDSFRLSKARQILEEIDTLLFELALMNERANPEEKKEVAKFIEEKQLLLKIQLLQQELDEGEGTT
ncbi:MAG: hypothetical protein N3B16_12990 [Candidatus Aminicenantes bacterium]|nr:hypothetical protein [Candidatus Aminicenantes bacterium]